MAKGIENVLLFVLFFVVSAALDEQWSKFGSSATGQFMLGLSMQNGIYVSDDFGYSWKHRGMTNICMWPCRHGAVSVSSDGRKMMVVSGSENDRIYLSEDFGASWVLTGPTTETFRSLTASKDASVIFAGGAGSLWKSITWGEHWIQLSGTEQKWWSLTSSADGNRVAGITRENYQCICCGCGSIFVSSDSGSSWTKQSPDGSFWDITSTGDFTHLWVATRRALDTASIWTSGDSGSSWTERIVSSSHAAVELGIASSFDGSVLAIVFEEMGFHPGWLYLSPDLGLTWSRADNFDGKNGCNHVAMSENGVTLLTGGVFGPPFTSPDSGVTWTAGTPFTTTSTASTTTTTMHTTTEELLGNGTNSTTTTTTTTTTFRSTSTNTATVVTVSATTTTFPESENSEAWRWTLPFALWIARL